LNTVDAVREKVLKAEKSVQNGNYIEEETFWNNIRTPDLSVIKSKPE